MKHQILGSQVKTWQPQFSDEGCARDASILKASAAIGRSCETIPLGTGRPSPEFYPWKSIGTEKSPLGRAVGNADDGSAATETHKRATGAYDFGELLGYGPAAGSPELLTFFKEHVELIHNPPYEAWETCLTCGSTSALEILLRLLCNRGDWIVTEAFTYSGTIEASRPLGLKLLGVEMDDEGMMPEDLDLKLSTWDPSQGRKPSVLYTIPCGHNPTGITQPTHRREAIYEVARSHDLCIIEDDPYFFLHLDGDQLAGSDLNQAKQDPIQNYLAALPTSYLSLDLDGRVVRLETASKILAPGLRCGWMTACHEVVARFLNHTEFSTTEPSGPSQLMMYQLLGEQWGHKGLLLWLIQLSSKYSQRLNILAEACRLHLPSELCSWVIPSKGMFLWIRLRASNLTIDHIQRERNGKTDVVSTLENMIYVNARNKGVQINKGSWFAVAGDSQGDICFRLTYAAAPEEALDMAAQKIAESIRECIM
ncbi:aromatic amino acid aminotransferase [Polychaeton citri CBS 116435]|uniref:Aromatic amino acid aminotransferase n=1 Tax=Polychaeton citri CBS 116435 TaxID=1314669 RepID=A0A9P4UNH6_9PEZI|nr:aromatic amino acid aminotransferase [Polychaeton citri CBS 116435]